MIGCLAITKKGINVTNPISAKTAPISSLYCQNGWHNTGITYRGWPVFIRLYDGTMAYEEGHSRLVSLPEEVEDRIVDLLEVEHLVGTLTPEAMDALKARAN